MLDIIKRGHKWRFTVSYLLFVIGVCTFSDKSSTSIIFYAFALLFAAFSLLEIASNKWLLFVNGALKAELLFLCILAASIFWQNSSAYYSTRLLTISIIVFFCILTAQWLNSTDDVCLALGCMVWANVFNCLYRFSTGGISEVLGKYVSDYSLIVGANDLAVTMVIVFSFSIFLYRRWNKKVYLVTAILFFSVGLMTASRKALVGFLLVIIIQYAIKDKRLIKNVLFVGLIIGAFWLVLSKVEIFSYAFDRLQRLIGFTKGETSIVDHSSEIRRSMREIGFNAFLQNPVLGYGVGYSYTKLGYGTYLHNNFVEVGVSLGIIGLIAFYLPHLLITYKALSLRKNHDINLLALSVIIVMLVMDYGAVTYFSKFIYLTLTVVYSLVYLEKQDEFQ